MKRLILTAIFTLLAFIALFVAAPAGAVDRANEYMYDDGNQNLGSPLQD